jgi:hypothetical protein
MDRRTPQTLKLSYATFPLATFQGPSKGRELFCASFVHDYKAADVGLKEPCGHKMQPQDAEDKLEDAMLQERIECRIYLIREHKIMLDSDLAQLYQVPAKRLNEQVHRNVSRFPADFMFQLTPEEYNCLRSQFGDALI